MSQIDTENKDVLLATALASGTSALAASRDLGMAICTVKRRMAEPSFRRLVADLRGEMVASALGLMSDNLTRAANSVAALLDAPEAHIRLRAARALFSFSIRLRDAVEVDQRIRDIEDELARKQGALR